ncbi:MAG TPA: hypothetical protein VEX13_14225 [Chloroflexia bacterium]|nr:hypothetical protein [Chloroflexia bacterium]
MQKLTFALMFHRAPKSNKDPTPQATAQSVQITTLLEPQGVAAKIESFPGETAVMTNTAALSNNNQGPLFFEWGTINFGGDANTLTFSSIGAGTLLGAPDADGFSHGTVMWKIDRGTGVFAGATGAITSNFLINLDTDELIDYHFYIIYLP